MDLHGDSPWPRGNSQTRMAEAPRKKAKTYNFHPEWEQEFLFTLVKDKCVCMLCHQKQALCKRGNLERHHNTNHPKFKDRYPQKSAIRARKVDELRSELKAQQSLLRNLLIKIRLLLKHRFV